MISSMELCVKLIFSLFLLKNESNLVHSFTVQKSHKYDYQELNRPNDFSIQPITKVEANDFNAGKNYFHNHKLSGSTPGIEDGSHEYETPVLIENVLSPEKCDSICSLLVEHVGGNIVDMQRKVWLEDEKSTTDIYQVKFEEALNYMMESEHDDSFFCFCEGLLEDENSAHLKQIQEDILFSQEKFFPEDEDLLSFFPKESQPTNCIVLAGEGATSTLHRDPFEWTGTSLCLEGTKLWRFIAPPGALDSSNLMVDSGVEMIDQCLDSYRLSSIAWDFDENESPITISSGWQSDRSLYAFRDEDGVPSAPELASLSDVERYAMLDSIAHNGSLLCPDVKIPTSIWTVVQKPGDLLIIPAHWWHQTYALEPSLAIASQRSGTKTRDALRTLRHILISSKCATSKDVHQHPLIQKFLEEKNPDPQKFADELFHFISMKR